MRTGDDDGTQAEELKPKKKLWQDEGRWSHDRFREDLQAPKSRQELMAAYGYDIRAADKPPDAPPPRRGRGRGRPQRQSKLSDFMEPPHDTRDTRDTSPPPPRMAIIDTTDYGPPPPRQPLHVNSDYGRRQNRGPPAFEDFDEDMEVPYMTTIDTSQSSAHNFQPKGSRRRGQGPQNRRERPPLSEDARNDHFSHSSANKARGGLRSPRNPPQDARYDISNNALPHFRQDDGSAYRNEQKSFYRNERTSYRNDERLAYNNNDERPSFRHDERPPFRREENSGFIGDARQSFTQDVFQQDFPSLNQPSRTSQRSGYRADGTGTNSAGPRSKAGMEGQERNSFPQSTRGARGAAKSSRERDNRPPRYSRMQREEGGGEQNSQQLSAAPRHFTNSAFQNSAAPDASQTAGNKAQGEKDKVSGDVVISNKENVQTISVTITNTTTQRKSYAKERRAKNAAFPALPGPNPAQLEAGADSSGQAPALEAPPPARTQPGAHPGASDVRQQQGERGSGERPDSREQSRPKRYSSQRQRTMQELGYKEGPPAHPPMQQPPPPHHPSQQHPIPHHPPPPPPQMLQRPPHQSQAGQSKPVAVDSAAAFYKQQAVYGRALYSADMASPPNRPPPPPQDPASFNPAMLQPPMSFPIPVSNPAMGNARLMNPALTGAPPGPVPISNPSPQLIPAPYLAAPGVIYTTPPPLPGTPAQQYQVPLSYTSPPPAAPPPALPQPQGPSSQNQPEVHRGGTVYFPPYLQQPTGRSTARRPKVAIPIVDPTELKRKHRGDGSASDKAPSSPAPDSPSPSQPMLDSNVALQKGMHSAPESSSLIQPLQESDATLQKGLSAAPDSSSLNQDSDAALKKGLSSAPLPSFSQPFQDSDASLQKGHPHTPNSSCVSQPSQNSDPSLHKGRSHASNSSSISQPLQAADAALQKTVPSAHLPSFSQAFQAAPKSSFASQPLPDSLEQELPPTAGCENESVKERAPSRNSPAPLHEEAGPGADYSEAELPSSSKLNAASFADSDTTASQPSMSSKDSALCPDAEDSVSLAAPDSDVARESDFASQGDSAMTMTGVSHKQDMSPPDSDISGTICSTALDSEVVAMPNSDISSNVDACVAHSDNSGKVTMPVIDSDISSSAAVPVPESLVSNKMELSEANSLRLSENEAEVAAGVQCSTTLVAHSPEDTTDPVT